jgi:hypothetical protein
MLHQIETFNSFKRLSLSTASDAREIVKSILLPYTFHFDEMTTLFENLQIKEDYYDIKTYNQLCKRVREHLEKRKNLDIYIKSSDEKEITNYNYRIHMSAIIEEDICLYELTKNQKNQLSLVGLDYDQGNSYTIEAGSLLFFQFISSEDQVVSSICHLVTSNLAVMNYLYENYHSLFSKRNDPSEFPKTFIASDVQGIIFNQFFCSCISKDTTKSNLKISCILVLDCDEDRIREIIQKIKKTVNKLIEPLIFKFRIGYAFEFPDFWKNFYLIQSRRHHKLQLQSKILAEKFLDVEGNNYVKQNMSAHTKILQGEKKWKGNI